MDKFSKVAFSITGICGAVFAVANWDWLVFKAQSALHQASVASNVADEQSSIWTYSQPVDEMTDRTHVKASAKLPWAGGNMVVDIQCTAPKKLSYTFVAYDEYGGGLPFDYELVRVAGGAPRQFVTVAVRLDEREAASYEIPIKNYTNEIYIESEEQKAKELLAALGFRPNLSVEDMAGARLLRISFKAKDREGVLRIEQDDPIVRRVFAACAAGNQNQSSVSAPASYDYVGQGYSPADANPEVSSAETDVDMAPPADAYSFADFPSAVSSSRIVEPQLDGAQKDYRSFRTRIREAIAEGPVFAGHIAIAQFGCGTSCMAGFAIDLSTGNIVQLPLGGEEYEDLNLQFQKNSNLMKATWVTDRFSDTKCYGQGYFEWNGSDFKQLALTRYPSGCS